MKDFIKEFYYGNIDPQARSIKQSKAVMKEKHNSFPAFHPVS